MELEHTQEHHSEMARLGRAEEGRTSKEMRCLLQEVPRGEDIHYPSKKELVDVARRIVQFYPMLQDKESDKHISNLMKQTQSLKYLLCYFLGRKS